MGKRQKNFVEITKGQLRPPPGFGLALFIMLVLGAVLFFVFWVDPATRQCLLDATNCPP